MYDNIANVVLEKIKLYKDTNISTIENYINTLNLETLKDDFKKKYSTMIWDKVSSINSNPPDVILAQHPYNIPDFNGVTVLIKKNDDIVLMQNLHDGEPLSEIDAICIASAFIDDMVFYEIVDLIIDHML